MSPATCNLKHLRMQGYGSMHRCCRLSGYRVVLANSSSLSNLCASRVTPCVHPLLKWNNAAHHVTSQILPPARRYTFAASSFQAANTTIYALSSAPGRAAIAVIRISGPACSEIYQALCPHKPLPKPRYAAVRSLYDPSAISSIKSSILDSNALVVSFRAPSTATGEDVLEFHVHGGPAIVKAVLSAIAKCNTQARPIRYAEPGEFTRRAFLNNRLDLPKIEALGDTLSAVTEEQRRLSVQGTISDLASRYEAWRQMLVYARGELEALIDFSEDQHFDESPTDLAANVSDQVRSLLRTISYYQSNAFRGELLRNGIGISLIGAPNVGKSSLLNLIVGRNAAIVSKEAGTTRDIIEVGIDIGGFFCRLGDTAGLRQQSSIDPSKAIAQVVGEIEQEGIRRAKDRAEQSDIVILVLSVEPSLEGQGANLLLESEVIETAQQLQNRNKQMLVVVNKIDNYGSAKYFAYEFLKKAVKDVLPTIHEDKVFCLSCREAEATNIALPDSNDPGQLQNFLSGLAKVFKDMTTIDMPDAEAEENDISHWQESIGTTQRQAALLNECAYHLQAFLDQAENQEGRQDERNIANNTDDKHEVVDIVTLAENLRNAADCLSRMTGRGEVGDVEEVLGVVFEK